MPCEPAVLHWHGPPRAKSARIRARPSFAASLTGQRASHRLTVASAGGVTFQAVSDNVTNLFPVWTVLAALLGLLSPDTFAAVSTKYFTAMLAALMLSMGITLTLKDFQDCLSKPVPVAINFVCARQGGGGWGRDVRQRLEVLGDPRRGWRAICLMTKRAASSSDERLVRRPSRSRGSGWRCLHQDHAGASSPR